VAREPRGPSSACGSCRGCCADVSAPRSGHERARHRDAGAAPAGARWACSRSSIPTPSSRPGRARRRRSGSPRSSARPASHSIEQVAEAMGEAGRWYQLYWPRDPRRRGQLRSPRPRVRGLRGDRRHARHLDAGLGAPARSAERLPAVPAGRGGSPTTSATPSSAPRSRSRPRRTWGRRSGTGPPQFSNPTVTWGGPGVAARADRSADPAEGHPARRGTRGWRFSPAVDGVIVSNHGGAPGGTVALGRARCACRPWREAVGERFPVLFDSGHPHGRRRLSRRSRSAPTRSAWGAPSCGGWRSTDRPASNTCCAACWPSST